MDKVIVGGNVAVIVHPGYGGGWYSWHGIEELLFDPMIVELIETRASQEQFEQYAKKYEGEGHFLADNHNIDELEVEWVPVGAEFFVHEYDGSETIRLKEDYDWIKA